MTLMVNLQVCAAPTNKVSFQTNCSAIEGQRNFIEFQQQLRLCLEELVSGKCPWQICTHIDAGTLVPITVKINDGLLMDGVVYASTFTIVKFFDCLIHLCDNQLQVYKRPQNNREGLLHKPKVASLNIDKRVVNQL